MRKTGLLLAAVCTATVCLAGCGSKGEATSQISDVSVAVETIGQESAASAAAAESTIVDDESAPGDDYVRSSITNEWVKKEVANARPIAVMMPTDSEAQPQYNIGNAGVLYECMEEGSISRQEAIIEGWQDMEKIGNIRSCRRYYIYPSMEWDSILVHFGGVFYMQDLITRSDINNISGTNEYGTGGEAPGSNAFFRSKDHASPHNAYTSGANLTKAITSLGYETNHRSQYWHADHFTFTNASHPNTLSDYSDAASAGTVDLKGVFPVTKTYLKYNETDGVYYKWLHNKEQVDAVTGKQLSFENVIIQITDSQVLDPKDYKSFNMIDSGKPGYYCTKGKVIPITWSKSDDYSPTKYYDKNGKEIVMNTGKTYIAIAQSGTTPSFE